MCSHFSYQAVVILFGDQTVVLASSAAFHVHSQLCDQQRRTQKSLEIQMVIISKYRAPCWTLNEELRKMTGVSDRFQIESFSSDCPPFFIPLARLC